MEEQISLNKEDFEYVKELSEKAYDLKSKMEILANQLRERRNKIEWDNEFEDFTDMIALVEEASEMVEEAYEQLDSYLEEHD